MDHVNSVHLVGRVAAVGEVRELPSGDAVQVLRVVVPREPPRRRARPASESRAAASVDTIDVACWSAASRRTAGRLAPDDHVEVKGALRRRFFRAGGGVASRYEVEAHTLRAVRPGDSRAG
ncbi:single-stranded DNA-binding protein [Oryzobacter terrae]|uniref:single-stranded DNA-binding protein n=1 Tax=Oryzobacter terrae TaxID=1620385 RepID=UPI00366C036C